MKVLVHARPAGALSARMMRAAAALVLRGHDVRWLGAGDAAAPAGATNVGLADLIGHGECDVVVGCGARAFAPALAGWLTRARAMVLAVDADGLSRGSALDRWAWHSLYVCGLLEESQADALRRDSHGVDPRRLALWSAEPAPAEADAAHPDTEVLERACERALARHRGGAARGAAFLDRDGTLVVERGYLADPDDLELLPGVPGALRALRAAGYAIVVISNQSGVGRGLFPLSRVHEAMARLRHQLRREGIEIDAIYFCPHRPDAGCDCRKPGTDLLERAAVDLGLSLERSCMIGDKLIDAEAGRRAGGRGVLLRTGYGRDEERRSGTPDAAITPDYVADDLADAARWWVATAGDADEPGVPSPRG